MYILLISLNDAIIVNINGNKIIHLILLCHKISIGKSLFEFKKNHNKYDYILSYVYY